MTKREWHHTNSGTKVTMEYSEILFSSEYGNSFKRTKLNGEVIRMNSNRSQALVKWNEKGFENWYGRTQIELLK